MNRLQVWLCTILVLVAGGLLALAWWDWTFPGRVWAWWHGETVLGFFWRRLAWMALVFEGVCLALWALSARQSQDWRQGLVRSSRSFLLAFLVLPFFARYTFHPLGVQYGSSVWTYGLVAVTAGVLAFPIAGIIFAADVSTGVGMSTGVATALRRWGWAVVCLLALLYALTFGFLSIARHTSFRTHALDLGTMDQAAWNTLHGRVLERTPLYRHPAAGSRYENRLLDAKLELILLPLSALYWLWPDPRLLLAVQSLFLAAGALPLYLLAQGCEPGRDRAGSPLPATLLPAILLAIAYLLYLPLHYLNMADFHPSALIVPFLIAAYQAKARGRWSWYYLWLVLSLCCRVDAAFAALALGIVMVVGRKDHRRHGLYTLGLAAAWLAIDFLIVVPAVRRLYGPGAGDLVVRRFGAWGNDPLDMLHNLVTRPALLLAQFADLEKLQAMFDLLVSPGPLPLLGPLALLPALPVLAINMLAESGWQHSIHAHYMAPVIPFIWIAAAEGAVWLWRRKPRWSVTLVVFALANTSLISWCSSPFPPGRAFRLADFYQPSRYQEDLRAVVALVPDGTSVCAQSDLYPHLSQRRDACLFDYCRLDGQEEAEYVIVDLDPTSTKSPWGYHAFYERVDAWLGREEYGVVAQQGSALLLRRGAPRENLVEVLAAIDAYGKEFYRAHFSEARLPRRLQSGELYRIPVTIRNTGSGCWRSDGQLPVRLSYRWLAGDDPVRSVSSLRTNLPHRVEPGREVSLRAWLRTPSQPGEYTLVWEVVREGDAWFGDKGSATCCQVVRVW